MRARRLLAALLSALSLAALIALALNYSQTMGYSLSWSAGWSAGSAPVAYQGYGASWSASWSLALMPWLSPSRGMPWAASWSLALMPWYTRSGAVPWSAYWLVRRSFTLPRWGGTSVYLEADGTVNVTLPSARSWIGYANLSGVGAVDFALPPGARLVAFGDVVLNGSRAYVRGSGLVAEVAVCRLVSVVDPLGYMYDTHAYFNGTKVAVGGSFPCVLGVPYTVAVDGGRVANVRVGDRRLFPPLRLVNASEFWLTVVVANPLEIAVSGVEVRAGAEGWVVVVVRGAVRDGRWGAAVPGAQVFLKVGGAAQDYAVTGDDGSFTVTGAVKNPRGPIQLELVAYHPDYETSSTTLSATAPPAGAGTAPAGLPEWAPPLLAAAVVAVAVAALWRARRLRGRALLGQEGGWVE